MALPQEHFDRLFKQLSKKYQNNLLEYMEYLAQKSIKEAWEMIPEEEVSEMSSDEMKQLEEKREYLSEKDAKREFNLHTDLP